MRRVVKKSKKTAVIALHVMRILMALIVILIGFSFWKLSVSPINIDAIVPRVADKLLPPDFQLDLKTKGAFLKTSFNRFGIFQITIDELTLSQPDGTVLTRLPAVKMIYGLKNLLTLNYIPNTLEIEKPTVQFVIDPQGRWMFQPNHKQGEKSAEEIASDLARQNQQPQPLDLSEKGVERVVNHFLSMSRVQIVDGSILLDDQQKHKTLSMPHFDLSLERGKKSTVVVKVASQVQAQNIFAELGVDATLNRRTKQMPFNIHFKSLDLASFSEINPALAGIKLVVDGALSGSFDFMKKDKNWREMLQNVSFKLENQKAGSVNLPAPLTNVYPIQSMLIQGSFSKDFDAVSVQESVITLKTGPIANVRVDVNGLDAFLKTGDLNQIQTTLFADVSNALINQVPDLWPSGLGSDAHAWVKQNLTGGVIDSALFTLYFKGAELVDLIGDIDVSGTRVDYLNPMPAVENVAGKVYLYPDKVEIFAHEGQVGQLQLKKADLYLTDLKQTGLADMRIAVQGPVSEAMALIDYKPLEFAKMFNLDPSKTGGTGDVDLTLNFPFKDDLQMRDVQTHVSAKITDGVFPLPFEGLQITNGTFDLTVTNKALALTGTAYLGAHSLKIKWDEFFEPVIENKKKIKTKYHVSGVIADDVLKPFYADIADFVKGNMGIQASIIEQLDGVMTIKLAADLKQSSVHLYPISLTKPVGGTMTVDMDIGLLKGALNGPLAFYLSDGDKAQIKGSVDLTNGFALNLDKVKNKENDFSGKISRDQRGNFTLRINGSRLNMSQLMQMPLLKKTKANEGKINIPNAQATPPDVDLDVRLNQFYMRENKPLSDMRIKGKRKGFYWQNLSADLNAAVPFSLVFTPQTRTVKAQSADMGDLLMRLGMSERIKGGNLFILANQSNTGSFNGEVSVKNFEVIDMGFFTQALTILGIVDALRGKEMSFKKAVIPFELTPHETLFINEGHANGTAVGVTFGGRISTDQVSLNGSVIPAYAINSLPGKIPFIGNLFKDGAGGGLMGLRYEITGTLGNMQTNFKPLSSLAPGILGKLFN